MSEKPPVYPKHLYDLSRLEIASTILQKEHRKLYLGLGEDAWTAIDESIIGWYEHPTSYHLEDGGPRDFWDSFAALLEGVKLKPNFTAWITAENVQWKKVIIPVRSIQMTSLSTSHFSGHLVFPQIERSGVSRWAHLES